MTKFKRHLALSTTAMLIASLAACSKHTLRETPKEGPALSTSSNPLKAEKEDAAEAKADARVLPEAEARELTDAEKDAALIASKKVAEARAAGKAMSMDEVADMFANDVQGAQIVETPAVAVPPAQAAGAPTGGAQTPTVATTTTPAVSSVPESQTESQSKAQVVAIPDASIAVVTLGAPSGAPSESSAASSAAAQPVATGSKRLSIVLPVPGSRGGATEVTSTVQTAPIASVSVADQAAVKRAFVKAMIAPTLRLNAQTMLQRQRVVAAQKKMADKVELSEGEKSDIAKLKIDYLLLDSKSTIEDLLARVDAVQMSFLIAPLAIKTKWNTEGQVSESLIASRIQELNVSAADDKVRFRSARLALKNSTNVVTGVELMKSFLAYSATEKNLTHEALIATVTEIAAMTQEPEMIAEIDRARLQFVEDARERTKPKDRN